MIFHPSPAPTLGVEWEVALIDPVTRDLVPRAADVVAYVEQHYPEVHLEREFLANTVELVTGVHNTAGEAVAELSTAVKAVKEAASELEIAVWASGSHPFADFREQPLSEKGHYNEIIARTQYWGNQMLIWGIHVHVGISDKQRVWPIINAVNTMYPHILALTASSPAWEGMDTGYASNRTMLYQQLPTAGLPYQFQTWEEFEAYMVDQDRSGVINHVGQMHFDIRPAGKWGTIEVRIADSTSDLGALAASVALTHCLVVYFDRLYSAGKPLPTLQDWHLRENKWRGARYGLDAIVITSRETDERLVTDDLRDWVARLEPIARELGCVQELHGVLRIIDEGASYQRQRASFASSGDWVQAVDMEII
ncbi:glutamate--cysteine ligase [Corynebacterium sp. 153RC1]|uniref:glutamate--cysteine ligase n=1 Tax=unclassified Corynebacterium TaxID=2624378 RepID=UPI00211C90DA|nr:MULTISPECIES: glutamate--cysteine ligase [unclassified Corynebacterium]MCQ9352512.1 glutamate--cysteine ligase [Corynebacterium sp. 209RC1]MCQ9354696.1 glutamate--cysteine ligase [Corynebacterium sp. 1222RC1]MCQ9356807.1 glutamate--cysteine ligase [Corynebacterium sp. 122RC1]MCQ9358989.1 glutamate--cysteine ligase [Corynebacterium sp. 142RC1]MCQ9361275.1 glutamate--cysteine ligase [Corynebacterium sp. 153RC1]